jgi:hypothetical protein
VPSIRSHLLYDHLLSDDVLRIGSDMHDLDNQKFKDSKTDLSGVFQNSTELPIALVNRWQYSNGRGQCYSVRA